MPWTQRTLQLLAIGHIVGGLLLPLVGQIPELGNLLVDWIFAGVEMTAPVREKALYLITLFGPTVSAWGILFLVLCNSYFEAPTGQKWYGLLLGVLLWFIGDSGWSLAQGLPSILLLNGPVALALLIPLWCARPTQISHQSNSKEETSP